VHAALPLVLLLEVLVPEVEVVLVDPLEVLAALDPPEPPDALENA
jgi:hypothetical protein